MVDFLKRMGKLALWVGVLFGLVLLGLYLGQGYFVYPGRALYRGEQPEWQARTANLSIAGYTPVQISNDGGTVDIRGLWRAAEGRRAPALLWFHDRQESVTEISHQLKPLEPLRCHIFVMEYRGFGQSPGDPSEAALATDAERVYDYVTKDLEDYDVDDVIAGGWGVGAALAVKLAGTRPVKGVLAFNPFTNLKDVMGRKLPYLPVGLVLNDTWDGRRLLNASSCPVFVVYGTASKKTPPSSALAWKEWGGSRVTLHAVEDADEENLLRKGGGGLWEEVDDFLTDAVRR